MSAGRPKQSKRPQVSLRLLLASISVLFLLLPIGGLYWLRLYESALIRQTESELISQSAFAAALYKYHLQERLALYYPLGSATYGLPLKNEAVNRLISSPPGASLDYATAPIYPVRPAPRQTGIKLDPAADRAGRAILPMLLEAQRTTLSGLKVLDYHGLVAAGQKERGLSFAHTPEYQLAAVGKPVSLLRDRGSHQPVPLSSPSRNASVSVYVALPITLNNRLVGVVWANRTPNGLMEAFYNKRHALLTMALGLLALTLLVVSLLAYTLTRPIRGLIEKTRLIAANHPDGAIPLANPVTAEISELAHSIAAMADALYHRNTYLREFTAHVSHALKTPITALQGSIELLNDDGDAMPTEQRRRFLANMAGDVDRLKRMVNRLMELAKADMAAMADMTEPGQTPVAVNTVLEGLIRQAQQQDPALTLTLECLNTDTPPGPLTLIPESNLEAVFTNLVDNSRQAGATQITLLLDGRHPDTLTLTVQDNGSGLSPGNAEKLFTPFFTTHPTDGGTGLGLSITRRLLESHGGSIRLSSDTSSKATSEPKPESRPESRVDSRSGACFVLTLPRNQA
ncbi:MAG: HAMP domain-containing histidine kinase [Cyanobacteria bacterium HKST-UBA03]|nr:HAMP domain-containing histidine kinase [Cyanobacteria bacterium HKST-UBA03]